VAGGIQVQMESKKIASIRPTPFCRSKLPLYRQIPQAAAPEAGFSSLYYRAAPRGGPGWRGMIKKIANGVEPL
jgi:hypothetical protein